MSATIRTARLTGLFYLGLAVTGMLGFLVVRNQIFVVADPAATLAHLVQHQGLARLGVALELGTVLTQTLAAVWFFMLFRGVRPGAAAGIAAFGLVNATMILISAAVLMTALQVAQVPFGDASSTVRMAYLFSGDLWVASGLFFGLWLIPMGQCVLTSRWMPRPLGWTLIVGGVSYVAGPFVAYLVPGGGAALDWSGMPATIGEFWILGYLLVFGVNRRAALTGTASVEGVGGRTASMA